jgi:hypothetical protein
VADFGWQILGGRFWVADFGWQILGGGFWVVGFGWWILGGGFWVVGFGWWVFWREKLILNFVEICSQGNPSMLALEVLPRRAWWHFGFGGKFEILNLSEIFS